MNNVTEQIFLLNATPNQSSNPTQRMSAIAPPPSNTQVNLDNVEDFSNVCRICATITELVMPILSGEGLQNKLGSKIKKHLPITVRERDELPLVVCYQCANTLLAWHELVKCCVQADLALHAKIAANKRKNNPPNNVTVKSSAIVQDEPQSKCIPEISPPATQHYRVCVYCASSHPVAKYKEHLAVNHFKLLFHCEDCDNLVDRREFRQHLSFHASQLKYKRKKAQNNNQAPTPAATNIVPKCSPKIESPKPIIKTKEENTPVPVNTNTSVPVKIDTPVPVKINTSVPVKINTSVPIKLNTPVPVIITTPVPAKINTLVPLKINTKVPVKIDTPVPSTINKTSVEESKFSDSDTEESLWSENSFSGFGPLPESVFDAIEDSQDGQQLTPPAGTTSHAPETERPKDQSIKSPQNNNNNMNNCSVVIEPMKIENCSQVNIATRNRSVMNILLPPENRSVPETSEVNNKQSTDEKGKKNQKTRKCPFCPKEYRASSSYFYHVKHSHEGAKEHECEVCGRKLYSKSSLTQHMTIHTSCYEYECSQCEKQFKSKAGLYIHEQIHKGTKSFSCNHCDTSFRWRTHLIRHMARHSGERAHVCGACGRGFSVRCDLLRHARTHSAGNFTCDKCGQKFAQLRYLKVHTTKQHARHGRRLTK